MKNRIFFLFFIGIILQFYSHAYPDQLKPINETLSKKPEVTTQAMDITTNNEPDLGKIMQQCNETFQITPEYLEELNTTGSFPDETNKIPMCYVKCYLENVGILDSNDVKHWNQEKISQMMWDGAGDIAADCLKEQEGLFDNDGDYANCEIVYYVLRCVTTQALISSRKSETL